MAERASLERAIAEINEWVDAHRVGNGGFDCVQARDVNQILDRHRALIDAREERS